MGGMFSNVTDGGSHFNIFYGKHIRRMSGNDMKRRDDHFFFMIYDELSMH